jgi:hypothetical protein
MTCKIFLYLCLVLALSSVCFQLKSALAVPDEEHINCDSFNSTVPPGDSAIETFFFATEVAAT